ncbi:MAG: protein translocase subunit SecD [Gammaproteobacteria bacterium]|jgi:preprotein translocase subunit SecD|uniref:protein translocase subunit SecD n=1 Tax=Pseudomonadaceae TaxID=135621 RepID=UPI0012F2FECE|nr:MULTISPECIES: protein translocase subunit SecD [Pseudomonadaceae]MBU0811241.1 protein translocase subunit SecD [Gammaproteobacteria bacterium]MBK3848155.1 protein translocase subunit SecD [Stutzerimonas xanthomarina]MBU0854546.1 protein translocase subunit SecD [Gammaproteobacteria bacterium]MBU1303197.1 protein translocase subunit SecD [Gammaproteobacteria bacterium]MBU1459260.1 protein translocase subunit SecD [Gammaproteobacteria bacterium]|tara:strand:+ start:1109 stop:2977 length:1869 start_codon:yes stop_codon:yes gene_type:complete
MLNRFPLWKYLLIVVVLGIAIIYSAPNLYPDDPAVQITGAATSLNVTEADLDQASKALAEAGIEVKAASLDEQGRGGLLRLTDQDDQLPAKDVVRRALGDAYVVALNLAPTTPEWLRDLAASPMKLGLDLSGGVHFLLEVDMEKAIETRLNVYEGEVKSLLRKERVRYRSLPLAENAVQLGFADEATLSTAQSLIRKNFNDFELTSTERNGQQVLRLAITEAKLAEIREYSIKQNLTTVRNRVNELGVSEPLVQRQGANRIVVELPGVQDTAEAKRILGKTANLEFRLAAEADAARATTETFEFREEGRPPVQLERNLIITGDQVTDAQASYDENGRPQVNIRLDGHGGDLMNRATRNNVGRSMAVVFIEQRPTTRYVKQMVDGVEQEVRVETFQEEKKVISLATIQSPLGSQFRITGLDGQGESSELALLLRAGGLAAPMYFAEERTIGPSLGAENIQLGVEAAMWGFLFVAVFMVLIYKFFGILATVALLFNMIVLTALMSMLGATLTLPGIAGIVLTMGMAVDANVLIFSRIREEIANGMSIQRAIHEGFDRAFSAIVDGNLTTLLVGGILFAMGTGPIKGFAVTLSLGIMTSMFTAVIVTRAMVNLIYGGRDLKKLWI